MAGQGSARVTLREIDLSQVRNPQQSPQGVPAAVVGTARKGPAFVPRTFANMQQFNEVFGSMLEVGKDSNSNLPGPLALNEWMRSAQAGTFLRVLGVGDGTKAITGTNDASLGKVPEAGFVVGQELVQARSGSNSAGKVSKNPKAQITESTADRSNASAAAKTHFLGCFMKDASGSSFLKDAGIETDDAPGVLTFDFDNRPATNDTFVLIGYNSSLQAKTFTITIANHVNGSIDHSDSQANGNITINQGDNPTAALFAERFSRAILGKDKDGNADGNSDIGSFLTASQDGAVVVVTQVGQGSSTNSQATINVNTTNADFVTNSDGDKISNSLASQSVTSTLSNAIAATSTITVQGNPTHEDTFSVKSILNQTVPIRLETNSDIAPADDGGTVKVGIQTAVGGSDNDAIATKIRAAIQFAIDQNRFNDNNAASTLSVGGAGAEVLITYLLKGEQTSDIVTFTTNTVTDQSLQ